ncbi:MAG: septum formation protein Maf [Opitutales bacterium]|nr:septum formation protein Maf [Opitutales bacterium]
MPASDAPSPAFDGLLLASASPRRRELLAEAGYSFAVHSPHVDELDDPHGDPVALVFENARRKAAAAATAFPRARILAADTTVALGSRILNKPAGREDALRMLLSLRGKTHRVHTAVATAAPGAPPSLFVETSEVTFHDLPEAEIAAYVDTARPFDKAGAYGIQDANNPLVRAYTGLLSNIIGLPVERLAAPLAALGIRPQK